MKWPLDPDVLMWIQIATGFFGGLTLMHYLRLLGRKLGHVLDMSCTFRPRAAAKTPSSRS